MRTIVYQSYRTRDVPGWIPRCMQSVRDWVRACGFDYRFFDDELFAFAPDWYRERARHDVLLVTDLARLVAARALLAEGHARTIWVDADVLVFAPSSLRIDAAQPYTFCRETWLGIDGAGGFSIARGINNAVTMFTPGTGALDSIIDACERIVRNERHPDPQQVGTRFLTRLHAATPLPLRDDVAMISPAMHHDFAHDCDDALRQYARAHGAPSAAANLCGSFRNRRRDGVTIDDAGYHRTIDFLLASPGFGIPGWSEPARSAAADVVASA